MGRSVGGSVATSKQQTRKFSVHYLLDA